MVKQTHSGMPLRLYFSLMAALRSPPDRRVGVTWFIYSGCAALVQSRKESGRATDSSGLRSAEAAKNHAINPAAIINAAPTK